MMNDKTMKNTLLIVFLATAVTSAERSITDFRVPPSSAFYAQIGLLGGIDKWSKSDQYLTGLLGGFDFNLQGLNENDDKALYGGLSLSFNPSYYRDEENDTVENRFYSWTGLRQDLLALTYINTTNWFTGLQVDGKIDWRYTQYTEKKYDHYITGDFNGGFEFGYGRLRDGTNLWKALEIERILKEEEIIENDLGSDELLAIAQTINQLQKFVLSHERYEKFYYQEMENQFQELGIDWVPAFVWFKIKEVIDFDIVPRRFGYRVGFGPYIEGNGSYTYYQYETYSRDVKYGRSFIFGQLSFNSAYPLTSRLQFDQGGMLRANDKGVDAQISVDLDYRVSLRIDFGLTNSFEYKSPKINFDNKFIFHAHELSFRYYLEDDMYFRSWCGYHRFWDDESMQFNPGLSAGVAFTCYVW